MKVLLINGSPHEAGCTFAALSEVWKSLNADGIETEIFQLGTAPVRGCIGCGKCRQTPGRCVFDDDVANALHQKIADSDGIVIGSPVYYAGPNSALTAVLDRVFYSGGGFSQKPACALVSARRGGTTAALDRLNKYFSISGMPIVPSQYWNMVHGNTPEEVAKDLEGLQIMRTLGKNMAWLLKCIEAGKQAGIKAPAVEERVRTNFIH